MSLMGNKTGGADRVDRLKDKEDITMPFIPVIELDQTDPGGRGKAYGESARESIGNILEFYLDLFQQITGRKSAEIVQLSTPFHAGAQAFAPDLVTEIRGIAEGANRKFEEIFLLNCRSEILFHPDVLAQECTSLLALPEATTKRELLLAQNWDWYEAVVNCQVILKIRARDGIPSLVTFTEAGQVAKIGMNASGIGLVVNNLISDQPRPGVPWIIVARRILESNHLAQAMGYVLSTPKAHSINYLLAHAGGEGVNLETSAVEDHVLWPEDGVFVHTNHYLTPGLGFKDLKPVRDPFASTFIRWRRASKGIKALAPEIDVEGMEGVLRDHFDQPFSVCVHPNPATEPFRRTVTCMSIVMNLTRQEIHYTLGNPCATDYQIMELSAFFS